MNHATKQCSYIYELHQDKNRHTPAIKDPVDSLNFDPDCY